jgi:hypothetical protein
MIIAIANIIGSVSNDIFGAAAADPAFKMTIDTTQAGSASDTFILPLASGSTYDFDIDWGDGNSETITSDTNVTHVYPSAGEYQIAITGDFPRIFFNNTGDRLKLMSIDNFGDIVWGSTLERAWQGCSNMVINASDVGNFGGVTNFTNAWRSCSSLTSFPLIDTSSGTNFQNTWNACSSLTSFPLIDTGSGTNFENAWRDCSSLTTFPLIDTGSGTNFLFTWLGCNSLTSFPLIDTSSGTNFQGAWNGCSSLTSFPLIDTSSGTTFQGAWRFCSNLATFPANAFNTNIATNYTDTFGSTALLTQSIDDILVSLDTSGVSSGTFTQSGGQGRSYKSNVAVNNLIDKGWTLTLTTPIASPEFAMTIDTTKAGSASDTFILPLASGSVYDFDIDWGDGSIETITTDTDVTHVYPSSGTYQIAITGDFPRIFFNNTGDRLKLMSIDNFGDIVWGSDLSSAWNGCSNMVISASDVGNFGSVTNFFRTWFNCTSLTSFPLLDTSSVTNFFQSWNGCSSLTSFPLIDTSSGTSFFQSWFNCTSLTSFPLIDTSSGTDFSGTWRGCSSLTSFPANAFDTNIATIYTNAFNNTALLTQSINDILVSLDTSGVINGTFFQSGGQAPSATGEAAIDSLVGKGWTITVTGGYTP